MKKLWSKRPDGKLAVRNRRTPGPAAPCPAIPPARKMEKIIRKFEFTPLQTARGVVL